MEFIMIK